MIFIDEKSSDEIKNRIEKRKTKQNARQRKTLPEQRERKHEKKTMSITI